MQTMVIDLFAKKPSASREFVPLTHLRKILFPNLTYPFEITWRILTGS